MSLQWPPLKLQKPSPFWSKCLIRFMFFKLSLFISQRSVEWNSVALDLVLSQFLWLDALAQEAMFRDERKALPTDDTLRIFSISGLESAQVLCLLWPPTLFPLIQINCCCLFKMLFDVGEI